MALYDMQMNNFTILFKAYFHDLKTSLCFVGKCIFDAIFQSAGCTPKLELF